MAQYLIVSSLVGQSISSFESHYRVIKSSDLLQKVLVQVAQERMPSYYSFIAFSVAHVQTVMEQHRDPGRGSQKKSRRTKQVERKAQTEKLRSDDRP